MKLIVTLLLLVSPVFADGVNKPKRKHVKHKVVKAETVKLIKVPKSPSLLVTKDELALYAFNRPTQPLNTIPNLPPEVIVTSETRVFEFEEKKKRPWWLLLGLVAIPFLLPDHDSPKPVNTPQNVPEGSTLIMLGLGLMMIYKVKKGWRT